MPGQPDQVHISKFAAGPFRTVVVQDFDARGVQLVVDIVTGRIAVIVAAAQIDQPDLEGRDRLRPDDALVVMAGFNDRANQPGYANSVGAHLHGRLPAFRRRNNRAEGLGIFLTEKEDMADLDPAVGDAAFGRHLALELRRVVHFVRCGIKAGPFIDNRLQVGFIVDIQRQNVPFQEVAMTEHRAFAGIGQNDEFMAHIAADRAGIRPHRDCLQLHPREGPKIGDEHLVIGATARLGIDIEGIGILHQEFAAAHDPEAGTDLVAEFPLDVVKVLRKLPVALDIGGGNFGDLFLIRRTVQHVPFMAVGDAQHLLAVILIPAALPPQIGGLNGRHQDFLRAGRILLLAHDLLDLLQHPVAQRQPRINARAGLPDHARPQHIAMRHDLRLAGRFLHGRQKILCQAHQGVSAGCGWGGKATGT